jgi:hypothetical protein
LHLAAFAASEARDRDAERVAAVRAVGEVLRVAVFALFRPGAFRRLAGCEFERVLRLAVVEPVDEVSLRDAPAASRLDPLDGLGALVLNVDALVGRG